MATVHRTCERCGKKHLGEVVYLELDQRTGRYYLLGYVPDGYSQGAFPFGRRCAVKELQHTEFMDRSTTEASNA